MRRHLMALQENPPGVRAVSLPEALRMHLLDPQVVPEKTAEDLLAGRLDFLAAPRTYGARIDWRERGPGAPSHLWRMHLHYHRFGLEAVVGALRRPAERDQLLSRAAEMLLDWSRACPPGEHATFEDAWSPYSASVRLLHGWMARRLMEEIRGAAADRLRRVLDGRAAADAAFLAGWPEHDLGGNHLLRNAVGLMAAGRWLSGPLGDRCRREGDTLLAREAGRQILSDGFHEERSPMYHAILLEDLLSLAPASPEEMELPALLLRALAPLTHPDGEIALFNDSAFGVAAPAERLRRLAAGLGLPVSGAPGDLTQAGYFRLGSAGDAVIFDAGLLGPDHLPAHSHCDALSFEMSLDGRRVVTDTGVDRYEAGPERTFQRSTAAHATLQVVGREQGEPFGSFRMGRRPRVRGQRIDAASVTGEHDGFGPVHRRTVRWEDRRLSWVDELDDSRELPVTVRLGLSPGTKATAFPGGVRVDLPGGGRLTWTTPPGAVTVEPGVYCPRFGAREPRAVLCWRARAGRGLALAFALGPS
jgi:uncharacterized heparinase superfamily protein